MQSHYFLSYLHKAAGSGFGKRYPDGQFWSGYEHHYGIGQDFEQAEAYARSQAENHGVKVIDDAQLQLQTSTAEPDTASSSKAMA